MMQRFNTEYSAGASQSNVMITLWDDTLAKWQQDGWVRSFTPPESAAFPAQFKRNNQIYMNQLIRSTLVSNKTRVRDADAPKDWADFFDAKWQGKIGMDPPWRSAAVQVTLAFWDRLGIKPPKLVPGIEGQKIVLSTELLTPEKQKAMINEWRSVFGLQ